MDEKTASYTEAAPKKRKRRRWWMTVLIIVAVLIIVRLVMPYFILKYVNRTLGKSKVYPGHVEDVDLALIRGAYVIKGVKIQKRDSITGKIDSIPLFASPDIDLSVEWRALFKGRIVGEIVVDQPRVYFVKGKHKNENTKRDTTDFQDELRKLMPLKINRFEIDDGEIHYLDPYSSPKLDVHMKNLQIVATNLSNTNDSATALPAGLKASADVYSGSFDLNMKFDAMNKQPTFDMNAEIRAVDMTKLNDFFRAYGNFDVNRGSFGLYTEFAAKNGKFDGYVKPLIKDLDVIDWQKEKGSLSHKLWEEVVAGIGEVFKNQPHDQVATKVPIRGSFERPNVAIFDAVVYVLRNAFVFALRPSIDRTIDLGSVDQVQVEEKKPLLKRIFGKKEDNKETGKKDGEKKGNEANGDKKKK